MTTLACGKRYLLPFLIFGLLLGTGFRAALAEEPTAPGSGTDSDSSFSVRIYVAREGDTLSSIAGQTRIYNNSLKWPLIYFFNREQLQDMKVPAAALPSTPLPPGAAMALVLPSEAEKRAVRRAEERPWVVNIMSSVDAEDLVPSAIRLIDFGRFAYISEWTFREKRWKRLRLGFFKDRETATESARMVLEELGLPNCWVVRAEWSELVEFSGYAE